MALERVFTAELRYHATNRVGGNGPSRLKCDCGWVTLLDDNATTNWAIHVLSAVGVALSKRDDDRTPERSEKEAG